MAAFAVGALAVTSAVSVATYGLCRTYLVAQRETSAVRQAEANARLVRSLLNSENPDVPRLLSSLGTTLAGRAMVLVDGEWYAASAGMSRDDIPAELRELVVDGATAGKQTYHHEDAPLLTVGIPLPGGAAYFETFPLVELSRTLRTIGYSLTTAAGVALVASLGVGYWASRRVLRPISDIGRAANAIAAGRLDARLDAEGDRELVALAQAFNAMVGSLQDRIDRDARFAADVSHELRSPLTTLRSAVEIMQLRRNALDDRSARALDLLAQEMERFETLVQELLEVSRYDAGVANLDVEEVDLPALLQRVLDSEGAGTAEVEVEGDGRIRCVDRRRLEHTVRNLARNAAAYGGGVTRAGVQLGPESVVIFVEDAGPGVRPGDREDIFDRFYRGQSAGSRSGTGGVGLGLALAKEHVRLHGGDIWVEDVVPTGARFVLQLPGGPP